MSQLPIGEVSTPDLVEEGSGRPVSPPVLPPGRIPEEETWIPEPVEVPPPGRGGLGVPGRTVGTYRGMAVFLVGSLLLLVIYLSARAWAAGTALFLTHPVFGWLYVTALACTLIPLAFATASALGRYRRLQVVTELQDAVRLVQTRGGAMPSDQFHRRVDEYLDGMSRGATPEGQDAVNVVRVKLGKYGGDPDRQIEALEGGLLAGLDRRADELIERRAVQVAISTALASHLFDPICVAWQSLALIDDVSRLYAGRPGPLGTLLLLMRSLASIVFAEVAQQGTEIFMELVSNRMVARLGSRWAEGFGNGLLILRLGESLKRECRPIPPTPRAALTQVQRLVGCITRLRSPRGAPSTA